MEYWDAYDEKRRKINQILVRGKEIPHGFYHLCVDVLVRHTDGDILLMRRSGEKEHFPHVYEASAGGSVLKGEDALSAIQRELKEETGLQPIQWIKQGEETFVKEQCHFDYFEALVAGDKTVQYQKGETDGHVWLSLSELEPFMESHSLLERQKRYLQSLLSKTKATEEKIHKKSDF